MSKRKKIAVLIILALFLIIFMQSISYANPFDGQGGGTGGTQSDDKLGLGNLAEYKGTGTTSVPFKQKLSIIFTAIRIIGTVLSVIILIVIGIKYMLGSVEEKADYKKTMMPYIYGTFFLFTGSLIPQIIYDFVKNIGW